MQNTLNSFSSSGQFPVQSGLDRIVNDTTLQDSMGGRLALLCHSASVDRHLRFAPTLLKKIFGGRLCKLLGPQHGLQTNVQDNMVESQDYFHPYFQMPVYSLYSHTRAPNEEMLKDIDTILVDMQDVGTRVYTYFSTLSLLMKNCQGRNIKVVVLDRPNPIGGEIIEGNILDMEYQSFVGLHPIPARHGLTLGEFARFLQKYCYPDCQLQVIPMLGWKRAHFFENTGLPWVLPSPNLPTVDGAFTFVGTVLYEGTNLSEGRGTTRSLEIIGHPQLEPYSFCDKALEQLQALPLHGYALRPHHFLPTFQKHQGQTCGGLQIHITDRRAFRPWKLAQLLCHYFYRELGEHFQWRSPPYEYEFVKLPIDLINGTPKIRHWVEQSGNFDELEKLEWENRQGYLRQREEILLYP